MDSLKEKSEQELHVIAKQLGIDRRSHKTREDLEDAIEVAAIKRRLDLEDKARKERAIEAKSRLKELGIDDVKDIKPSPETICIDGGTCPVTFKKISPSPKKYYLFSNNEDAGVKRAFRKGEKYRFELYDGKIHVLPECIVKGVEHTEFVKMEGLRKSAQYPVYENRKNPISGIEESVIAGYRPRFGLEELGDAPDNAAFGVVIDKKVEEKFLKPVLSA